MRCIIGCGCGRRGPNRADRIKKQTSTTIKARKKNIQASRVKTATISPLSSNSASCLSCIESKQSRDERKKGIRVCHKTNRLINNLIRDPRFVCPLGKWRNSK